LDNTSNIEIVDLTDFREGNITKKTGFVQSLGQAFVKTGFVAVKNHTLRDEDAEMLYAESKKFFALPDEVKQKYEIEGLAGQRGYTAFGKEHAKGRKEGDLKEFWHIGQEVEGDDPIREIYPDNISPTEISGLNTAGIKVYKAMEQTGKYLLRAIALYLGLDELYFDDKIYNGNSILRPIHYGPISGNPKNAMRAAEHEDINLITLLMGASAEGLEILSKSREWVPVTALPNQIVVNVGDMLQRLTNNKLRSSTHRVVNPPEELWHSSRYSIPFFLHPRPEMPLDCLESCIDNEHPKRFENITAGEYLSQRLREIGLK